MNPKAASALEFPKIISRLVDRAATNMGKALCAELAPTNIADDVAAAQNHTEAAATLITKKGSLPLGGISDIRPYVQRAAASGMLNPEELMAVCNAVYAFAKLRKYASVDTECLTDYFEAVQGFPHLESEINRCISSGNEIHDNASQKLSGIRRAIRQAHTSIRTELGSIIQSARYKNMLQDAVVTIRAERFCVPIKAEYRSTFPGMVHDQSSSGATVFMEPLKVVQMNNKIKDLNFEAKREEERILYELSALVADSGADILASLTQAVFLDFVFAKGELALAMDACKPMLNTGGKIVLHSARHPLLSKQSVVATSVELGDRFSMLLITGPNTGGKTVQLKTIGLLTLMAQAGLHIPANDGSQIAIFDNIFADIGDEQSIEQSLSTFSSHMKNIVKILQQACPNSLVLLDELGAGTDPTEGAALAIALLEHLHENSVRTVVTTHFSELKLFAITTPGCENASCEFDVETLSPTYRLLIGVPGKSNAFAIAKRLGLMDGIIERAKSRLSHSDIRFEDVIAQIEATKSDLQSEQERAQAQAGEAALLLNRAKASEEKISAQRQKLMQRANDEAKHIVDAARRQAEELLAACKKNLAKAGRQDFEAARRDTRAGFDALRATLGEPEPRKPVAVPENLRLGEGVLIHSLNSAGTVAALPDAGGFLQVQAGIMKIKAHISDISRQDDPEPSPNDVRNTSAPRMKALDIRPEIDLRGKSSEEAGGEVEKYIDDAFLAGLATITLIHGKGTGTLRKHIHKLLGRHPHVGDYRLGAFGEGEDGVTIVTLK